MVVSIRIKRVKKKKTHQAKQAKATAKVTLYEET